MQNDVEHIEVLDYLLGLMDTDIKKLLLIMSIMKQHIQIRESEAITHRVIEKAKR